MAPDLIVRREAFCACEACGAMPRTSARERGRVWVTCADPQCYRGRYWVPGMFWPKRQRIVWGPTLIRFGVVGAASVSFLAVVWGFYVVSFSVGVP